MLLIPAAALPFYGDARRYPELIAANSETIHSANDLRAGMVLVIP